jgi:hypothetical protein
VGRGLLLCEGGRNDDQTSCEKCERSHVKGMRSNENKMSDGWRESAWLRVENGVSRKVRNQGCQPFDPSHG